ALGVLVLIALFVFVPTGTSDERRNLRSELAWLRTGQVWLTLAVSVLGFGGVFGAFSYLAFTLDDATGLGQGAITALLFLFGIGTFVGNLVGGSRWAGRLGDTFLIMVPAVVAVIMVAFAMLAGSVVAAAVGVFAMGAVGFALTPGTQARTLAHSDGAAFASSANIAALNFGNWIGATVAGVTIDAGLGATSPLMVGAGLSVLAAMVMAVAARRVNS
ncbi:MAG: MFS transporter, partial [Propionibacteriales bacterium]|nr:MFS transporter [Propionibacteriales bacterium]